MNIKEYSVLQHSTAQYLGRIDELSWDIQSSVECDKLHQNRAGAALREINHAWALSYAALGLAGEAGEVANKVKKHLRGDKGKTAWVDIQDELADELGDVFWYLFELCHVLSLDPAEVMALNIDKLQDRQQRGVIKGSGDDR